MAEILNRGRAAGLFMERIKKSECRLSVALACSPISPAPQSRRQKRRQWPRHMFRFRGRQRAIRCPGPGTKPDDGHCEIKQDGKPPNIKMDPQVTISTIATA
jgi:hypothetical protein